MAEKAVSRFDWLRPGEMLDGLGMAETTPGPLIMVLEFVGYLAAYRNPGELPPVAAGILGAAITTWVTFTPCFLWIFLGAPYIEALRGRTTLNATLSAITAAVVGVVLNLSIWFAMHGLFGTVETRYPGYARFLVPELRTLNKVSALLAAGAAVAIFRLHAGMIKTLVVCTALGPAYSLLTR